jgi:hypothetical protein
MFHSSEHTKPSKHNYFPNYFVLDVCLLVLSSSMKMDVVSFSEMSEDFYRTGE